MRKSYSKIVNNMMWFMALLLVVFTAGCDRDHGTAATQGTASTATPPTVTLTSPARGVTGVPINRNITATFSEAMDPASITTTNFTLRAFNSGALISGNTVTLDSASNIASFILGTNLAPNTSYVATISTGVKSLAAGTAMAADYNWSFTTALTPDTTAPIVIATAAYGFTGLTSPTSTIGIDLPINRVSTATFNKAMDPLTLSSPATNFTIKEAVSGNSVPGTVTYIGDTATFTPTSNLSTNTTYTSTITTGARDLSGNAMAANYIWSWTTGTAADMSAPTVTFTNPADLATNVPINKTINATFSKEMKQSTMIATNYTVKETVSGNNVPGTVSYDLLNNIATFTPLSNLTSSTNYTATVTNNAADLAGNKLVVPAVGGLPVPNPWTFTTSPVAVPAPGLVNLGRAATFGIASTAGVSNTITAPITHINGDVVLNPLDQCNAVTVDNVGGFGLCGGSPPTINGKVYTLSYINAASTQGVTDDLRAAYLFITPGNMPGGTPIAAGTTMGAPTGSALVLGDNLFYPGVYTSITSMLITGDLTLDARGDPNATFVFQSASTIGSADGPAPPALGHTRILLVNGAKASNVWWQAGSSATLGLYSEWQGNILAYASITMKTGATSCGRLFAGAFTAGAFIFDSNVVSVPGNPSAPPSCQ
jgi:hypothetical protein